MRYPLFYLEGYDLEIYDKPEWVKGDLEPWPEQDMGVWLDSDGRVLIKTPTPDKWVELTDSGVPPDLERLRFMLLRWLGCRYIAQQWNTEASLDCLINGARARIAWHEKHRGINLSEAFSKLLRVLRLRRPRS